MFFLCVFFFLGDFRAIQHSKRATAHRCGGRIQKVSLRGCCKRENKTKRRKIKIFILLRCSRLLLVLSLAPLPVCSTTVLSCPRSQKSEGECGSTKSGGEKKRETDASNDERASRAFLLRSLLSRPPTSLSLSASACSLRRGGRK